MAFIRTTLEIPDTVFRRAKSVAAQRGIPLREFMTEAVKDKLAANAKAQEKPWVKHMGKLKHLRKETERINRLIEEDSEKIDPEMWRRYEIVCAGCVGTFNKYIVTGSPVT